MRTLQPLAALFLSQWWFVHWFGARVRWGGSEGYEWVAFATLALVVLLRPAGEKDRSARSGWVAAATSALAFAATFPWLGDLGSGLVAATGLAVTASVARLGRGSIVPAASLAWLSLPVVPLLQLHLGFPLRALTAKTLVAVNRAVPVVPDLRVEGAALVSEGRWLLVDEPCSGVRLLWTALFVAGAAGLLLRLTTGRSAILLAMAAGLAACLQGVRTAGLAVAEWRLPAGPWQGSLHDVSGVVGAGLLFALVCALGLRLTSRRPSAIAAADSRDGWARRVPRLAIAGALLAATVTPLVVRGGPHGRALSLLAGSASAPFPGWPETFEGEPLRRTGTLPEDEAFLARFRGELARFSRGDDEVILAWTSEPTADMHSTAVCLRGAGYTVVPRPALLGEGGEIWSRFRATRGAVTLFGRERIRDAKGQSWSDLSAWWWAALFGRTHGPWWKELVVSRGGQPSSSR